MTAGYLLFALGAGNDALTHWDDRGVSAFRGTDEAPVATWLRLRLVAGDALTDAARADVVRVVPAAHARDADDVARVRRVDELVVSDVDADVVQVVEEDEV